MCVVDARYTISVYVCSAYTFTREATINTQAKSRHFMRATGIFAVCNFFSLILWNERLDEKTQVTFVYNKVQWYRQPQGVVGNFEDD